MLVAFNIIVKFRLSESVDSLSYRRRWVRASVPPLEVGLCLGQARISSHPGVRPHQLSDTLVETIPLQNRICWVSAMRNHGLALTSETAAASGEL